MILAFGLLSDYVGRRKMFLTGMAVLALFAVPYFMLVSTSNIWLFLLGGLIVQACRSAVYGPQSAYFAEQFSTRMRYSGSSLAYQFAAILGGMAPAGLHGARRRDRKRVLGSRVRHSISHGLIRLLVLDDRDAALRAAQHLASTFKG
jgi:MFS family permease